MNVNALRGVLKTKIDKRALLKILIPLTVIGVSIFVLISWVSDFMPFIRSLGADRVSMKFLTSLSFFLCAVSMLLNERPRLVLLGMILMLSLMGFISMFPGISSPLVLTNFETIDAVNTVEPNLPSIPTILSFIFFVFGCVSFNKIWGMVIIGLAGLAIIGYLVGIQEMYYYIDGVSTAMAIHTAVLFLHLGAWLEYERVSKEKSDFKTNK